VTAPGHAAAWTNKVPLHQGKVAMRPVRTITAFVFAAVPVTGCTGYSTAVHPAPRHFGRFRHMK
jgi:hypothetical protein